MSNAFSYIPNYKIGEPLDSIGVSEVISSKRAEFPIGSIVYGMFVRWEEFSVVSTGFQQLQILPRARELIS